MTTQRTHHQGGFTLLELLVAMLLVLVVIIGVQRFMAGVVVDQAMIGERQADASETQLVLSNLSRDVARANFYPYASFGGGLSDAPVAECATDCESFLFGVRYAAPVGTKDCNGSHAANQAVSNTNGAWVLIENRYVLTKKDGVQSLSCAGSGGDNGQVRQIDEVVQVTANAVLNNGSVVNLTATPQFISVDTKLVQVCLLTRVAQRVDDVATATTDCAGVALVDEAQWGHYKTQMDVAVGSNAFFTEVEP